MSQSVNGQMLQIIVCKIKSESAFEIFDSTFELFPVQRADRSSRLFKIIPGRHKKLHKIPVNFYLHLCCRQIKGAAFFALCRICRNSEKNE